MINWFSFINSSNFPYSYNILLKKKVEIIQNPAEFSIDYKINREKENEEFFIILNGLKISWVFKEVCPTKVGNYFLNYQLELGKNIIEITNM